MGLPRRHFSRQLSSHISKVNGLVYGRQIPQACTILSHVSLCIGMVLAIARIVPCIYGMGFANARMMPWGFNLLFYIWRKLSSLSSLPAIEQRRHGDVKMCLICVNIDVLVYQLREERREMIESSRYALDNGSNAYQLCFIYVTHIIVAMAYARSTNDGTALA